MAKSKALCLFYIQQVRPSSLGDLELLFRFAEKLGALLERVGSTRIPAELIQNLSKIYERWAKIIETGGSGRVRINVDLATALASMLWPMRLGTEGILEVFRVMFASFTAESTEICQVFPG